MIININTRTASKHKKKQLPASRNEKPTIPDIHNPIKNSGILKPSKNHWRKTENQKATKTIEVNIQEIFLSPIFYLYDSALIENPYSCNHIRTNFLKLFKKFLF